MFQKMLLFPFWLLSGIVKLFTRLLSVIFSAGSGAFRLVINRFFGLIFGALIGFFLGKGHIGIKLFKKKKRVD